MASPTGEQLGQLTTAERVTDLFHRGILRWDGLALVGVAADGRDVQIGDTKSIPESYAFLVATDFDPANW